MRLEISSDSVSKAFLYTVGSHISVAKMQDRLVATAALAGLVVFCGIGYAHYTKQNRPEHADGPIKRLSIISDYALPQSSSSDDGACLVV